MLIFWNRIDGLQIGHHLFACGEFDAVFCTFDVFDRVGAGSYVQSITVVVAIDQDHWIVLVMFVKQMLQHNCLLASSFGPPHAAFPGSARSRPRAEAERT